MKFLLHKKTGFKLLKVFPVVLSNAALLLTEEIQINFTNGKFLLLMIIVWGLIVQKQSMKAAISLKPFILC